MRGATRKVIRIRRKGNISTHTPHAGRDYWIWICNQWCIQFLLTRLLRGATCLTASPSLTKSPFLLTRLLRGATCAFNDSILTDEISTHTPLARRDRRRAGLVRIDSEFLLTRPMRGATPDRTQSNNTSGISTHTPLARRDWNRCFSGAKMMQISTHTPLTRRDRFTCFDLITLIVISTHTPLARRDVSFCAHAHLQHDFYSHASCEARLKVKSKNNSMIIFLLTRLLRGATSLNQENLKLECISTHTPHAGRD